MTRDASLALVLLWAAGGLPAALYLRDPHVMVAWWLLEPLAVSAIQFRRS